MSRLKHLKEKRDQRIRDFYAKMAAKEINGQQLYRHPAILAMASDKFCLAELTIQNIVSGNAESTAKDYVDPNQKSIFDEIPEEDI